MPSMLGAGAALLTAATGADDWTFAGPGTAVGAWNELER